MKPHLPFKLMTIILGLLILGLHSENLPAQKPQKHAKIKVIEINDNGEKVVDTIYIYPSIDNEELEEELAKLEGNHELVDSLLKEIEQNIHFDFEFNFADDLHHIFDDALFLGENFDDILVKNIQMNGDIIIINGDTLDTEELFHNIKEEDILKDHGVFIFENMIDDENIESAKIIVKADCVPGKSNYSYIFNKEGKPSTDCDKDIIKIKMGEGLCREVYIFDIVDDDKENLQKQAILDKNDSNELKLEDLKFYPNPSDGKFSISFANTEKVDISLKIYNLNGNEVFTDFSNDKIYENSIDISKYGSGTYFIKISIKNKSLTKKIIIN